MFRLLVVALLLAGAGSPAFAQANAPIRVALDCQEEGRTKACPAFLLGLIEENKVLLSSPRAGADVVVYAAATEVSLVDHLHLRFVGAMPGAPMVIETEVDLDSRATDDEQRAALAPAFLRGIALFVAARYPGAVTVGLSLPAAMANVTPATSPWGIEVGISGSGSYTKNYRSASSEVTLVGRYVTRRFRALTLEALSGRANRQPPLTLEDGTVVSLDSKEWATRFGAEAIYLLDDCWSVGLGSYWSIEDPKAQYRYNSRTRAAISWDMFPADDPRGNHLSVFYHLGWAIDRYNLRNELGERFAQYPLHGIDAVGSVRHDRISYGLKLQSDVQVNHPARRAQLTASPFVQIQIGTHVDVELSFSVTKRQLPAPDKDAVDSSDYEQLSRLSYAEPFSMNGSIGITVHWDPTNGARNNRLESI